MKPFLLTALISLAAPGFAFAEQAKAAHSSQEAFKLIHVNELDQ